MTKHTPHPQRLAPASAPGSLLKRAVALHVSRKLERTRELLGHDPAYLAAIRQLPCLKCGLDPAGVAAHVRMNSGLFNKRQAMARKPHSKWTVPLCNACHTTDADSQHKLGELAFWNMLGVNPLLACERLYTAKGDITRMRAIAFQVIGERAA